MLVKTDMNWEKWDTNKLSLNKLNRINSNKSK